MCTKAKKHFPKIFKYIFSKIYVEFLENFQIIKNYFWKI